MKYWRRDWKTPSKNNLVLYGIILSTSIFVGIAYSYYSNGSYFSNNTGGGSNISSGIQSYEQHTAIIYVGSSTCVGNNYPDFKKNLESLIKRLIEDSRSSGPVLTIGVSNDNNLKVGREYLEKLYQDFDEISIGNNWFNIVNIKYGITKVPSILVVDRKMSIDRNSISLSNERVKLRLEGAQSISDYVRRVQREG